MPSAPGGKPTRMEITDHVVLITGASSGIGASAAAAARGRRPGRLRRDARAEWAGDGIVVSTVLPTYTESEFHDKLQAGADRFRGPGTGDTAEHVAEEILRAVETGVEEIDLPRVG